MNPFALSFLVMLAFILAELAVLKFRHRQPVPWVDVVFNLNSGHVLMWVFRGTEVLLFSWTLQHANLHWLDAWPTPALWAFGIVAWDFSFYWMHRLHHRIPLLWAVHGVHHQGEHFNLSLGVRNSWYSSLTSFPFVALLAVLGLPLDVFVVASSLHYTVQLYNHNSVVQSSGILDRFLITPAHHRVHHAVHPTYLNKNFGGTFLLWDKLFGSFQSAQPSVPLVYGVPGPRFPSDNPVWANNPWLYQWAVRAWGSRANAAGAVRHADAPHIGAAGVLLFLVVIYFVNHQQALPQPEYACLLVLLFLSTIALGGVSDGRPWGKVLWAACGSAGFLVYGALFGVRDAWGLVTNSSLIVHTLWFTGKRTAP